MKTKKRVAMMAVTVSMMLMITVAAQAGDMYGLIAGTTNTWNTTTTNWSTAFGGPYNSTWVDGSGAILTNGTTGAIITPFTVGSPITLTKLVFGGGLGLTVNISASGGGSLMFSNAPSYLIDSSAQTRVIQLLAFPSTRTRVPCILRY